MARHVFDEKLLAVIAGDSVVQCCATVERDGRLRPPT